MIDPEVYELIREEEKQQRIQDMDYEYKMRTNDDFFALYSHANEVLLALKKFKKDCQNYDRDFGYELSGLKDML